MRFVSWCLLTLAFTACGEVLNNAPDAPPPEPAILAIDPPRGIVTTVVTVTGTAFGETQGESTITLGGMAPTVQSWSDTSIVIEIPDMFPGVSPVVVTTGNGASAPVSVRVTLPPRLYLHNNTVVTPSTSDFITVMTFDPGTGALAELGVTSMGNPPASFGGCMDGLVVHEGTRRLFAGGQTGIAVFDINATTGMLTAVPGSPFLGAEGYGLHVDNAGRRLWRAGPSGVFSFGIAETGALFPIAGSPLAVTPSPLAVYASHDESYLYAKPQATELQAFSLAPNGAVTQLTGGPFPSGYAFSLSQHPDRDQLVVASAQSIEVWELAPGTGIPAQVPGSPFLTTVPSEDQLHHIAFTSDGGRAYGGTFDGGFLMGFDVAASGALTPLPGTPWDFAGTVPAFMCTAAARDTSHLIVTPPSGTISVLELAADGTPTHVTGSPFAYTSAADVSGVAITF